VFRTNSDYATNGEDITMLVNCGKEGSTSGCESMTSMMSNGGGVLPCTPMLKSV